MADNDVMTRNDKYLNLNPWLPVGDSPGVWRVGVAASVTGPGTRPYPLTKPAGCWRNNSLVIHGLSEISSPVKQNLQLLLEVSSHSTYQQVCNITYSIII